MNEDFRDILRALSDADARFLVVGAYAVSVHAEPRATGDLDICIRPTAENARRVWQALVHFGAPVQSFDVEAGDFARPGMVYQIGLPPRRIDIITQLSGLSFEEAWESRENAELGGRVVYVIGRDALLLNKRAAGRAKDLADVERLEGNE